jgi:hypothetical protein
MNELIEYCRKHPHSKTCIFPFQEGGAILRLVVENPFYNTDAAFAEAEAAKNRLQEAPKKLREILEELNKHNAGDKWK